MAPFGMPLLTRMHMCSGMLQVSCQQALGLCQAALLTPVTALQKAPTISAGAGTRSSIGPVCTSPLFALGTHSRFQPPDAILQLLPFGLRGEGGIGAPPIDRDLLRLVH